MFSLHVSSPCGATSASLQQAAISGSSAPSLHILRFPPRAMTRLRVVLQSSEFNFAEMQRVRGVRRNRVEDKKEAAEVLEVVQGLVCMTPKQLAAVSHLLTPQHIDAIRIAAKLPRSNQGRKRQENLVAKMLRGELAPGGMAKLLQAVHLAQDSAGIYTDNDADALVAVWAEGLMAGDPEAVSQLLALPPAWGADLQRAKQLARQCGQEEKDRLNGWQEEPAVSVISSTNSEAGTAPQHATAEAAGEAAAGPSEVVAELQEALSTRAAAKKRSKPGPSARTQLNRLLRPLAVQLVAEQAKRPDSENFV